MSVFVVVPNAYEKSETSATERVFHLSRQTYEESCIFIPKLHEIV